MILRYLIKNILLWHIMILLLIAKYGYFASKHEMRKEKKRTYLYTLCKREMRSVKKHIEIVMLY